MRGSGGTDGGLTLFGGGLALTAVGAYLLMDSVRATTAGHGIISGLWRGGGGGHGGWWETTSMGIVFVPFLLGVGILFYDSRRRLGWWVLWGGIAVILIEVLSRIRFYMNTKLTHLLLMLVLIAGGLGLILRSFRDAKGEGEAEPG